MWLEHHGYHLFFIGESDIMKFQAVHSLHGILAVNTFGYCNLDNKFGKRMWIYTNVLAVHSTLADPDTLEFFLNSARAQAAKARASLKLLAQKERHDFWEL